MVTSIGMTMYRLVIGFGISIAIGVTIGITMVKFIRVGKTISSFAVGLKIKKLEKLYLIILGLQRVGFGYDATVIFDTLTRKPDFIHL